jgi:hypothetical protein
MTAERSGKRPRKSIWRSGEQIQRLREGLWQRVGAPIWERIAKQTERSVRSQAYSIGGILWNPCREQLVDQAREDNDDAR